MDVKNTQLCVVFRYSLVVGLLIVMGACASSNIPAPNTSETESKISQAEQAGAQEYAPLELRNARKKIEQAKQFNEQEEYEKATRLVEEASVDAELATVKARSAKAQEAVEQLRQTIETLRKEIERNQRNQGGSL
jgi:chromosome segregation ATPase